MDNSNLDKTLEIRDMILEEYYRLDKDSFLVIDYTGSMRYPNLYHILEWYISCENRRRKMNFDNRHFNYYKLIEELNKNAIEYINYHISMEAINEHFKKNTSLNYSFKRDFETVSKFYIAENIGENANFRRLIKTL